MEDQEKIIPTICHNACGGGCVLNVHVRDGVVAKIETDDGEGLQYRACAKGRAHRQWMYSPDRLKYPMKRIGERGEGKFERISWGEALNKVADELKSVYQIYGAPALLLLTGGGDLGQLHRIGPLHRLFCLMGGCSLKWGIPSYEGAEFASLATFGTTLSGNTRDDLLNSKLIIMWGLDVASTPHHTNTSFYLAKAREKGIRIVSVDPKYTNSTAAFAHQWIPIRPGTDTAMLIAMAYVLINERLYDQSFIENFSIGFDSFKSYVLGKEDGVAKTPSWAESITAVSSEAIISLAREYGTAKPSALMPGWSAGRTFNGEQFHRAIMTLSTMTGNVGINGGNSGAGVYGQTFEYSLGQSLPVGRNQVEENAPPRGDSLPSSGMAASTARIHNSRVWDAILEGKAGGYPADYKMLYLINSNYLNQHPNINKGIKALKILDFIVAQEQFITSTAKFADILLPVTYFLERNDITTSGDPPFYGYMNKTVEPYFEAKSHLEIATALAQLLGISGFNDMTEEELLRGVVAGSKDILDYDILKGKALYPARHSEPKVAFKAQIETPLDNPFPTPSGKIEIYSQQIADMKNPMIPPIPKYIETWENLNNALADKYPLQLISTHPKLRVHSQFHNAPWLTELEPHAVTINESDARARGIQDKDPVCVFNDRGEMIITARVTQRIIPGVVDIPEGAWFNPDEHGTDRGGCVNILTRDASSPAGAFTSNACLVQVRRAQGNY